MNIDELPKFFEPLVLDAIEYKNKLEEILVFQSKVRNEVKILENWSLKLMGKIPAKITEVDICEYANKISNLNDLQKN
ncbi:hypothetical protein [Spiroplasma sp. DGKH1]|uniref:hypothetical protein n=1 Tax=Spiroplasma sp. DGKH1 TaxID=3050074 RepID=UPI0034C69D0D